MEIAKEFRYWITSEVIPTIRKTNKYSLNQKDSQKMNKINDQIKKYKKRIKILENNQKKEKFPDGGYIYVIKGPAGGNNEYKIGKTEDLNKRLNVYNVSYPDKVEVVYKKKVKNPIAIEMCLKSLLYNFRYRNGKEYYKINLQQIKNMIDNCDNAINKNKKLKRHINTNNSNTDEIYGFFGVDEERGINEEQKGGNIDVKFFDNYVKNKNNYIKLCVAV